MQYMRLTSANNGSNEMDLIAQEIFHEIFCSTVGQGDKNIKERLRYVKDRLRRRSN